CAGSYDRTARHPHHRSHHGTRPAIRLRHRRLALSHRLSGPGTATSRLKASLQGTLTMPIKLRRIDWSFDEWIAGTLGMTLEEEGLYCRIVNRIYSRGEALPDDPAEVARLCGLRPQQVRRLLPKLRGKFDETPGKLRQNRCETEMKLARNRLESARLNGAKGGKSRHLAEP